MVLLKYTIYLNHWLWFHIFGGGLLAKIFIEYGMQKNDALFWVMVVAVAWEFLFFAIRHFWKGWSGYGDMFMTPRKHYFLDAIGDVVGALIMALVVLY